MSCDITIDVKSDRNKIKNGIKRRFFQKSKKRKKRENNDQENNLTFLHLLLLLKLKTLFTQFNFNQQIT